MWQNIAIIIIGFAAAAYVVWKTIRLFKPKHKEKNALPCCGCSGCTLKDRRRAAENCPDTRPAEKTDAPPDMRC